MPSPYRRKPFDHDEIAPEDVELEEIYRTQGPEAYQRREHELNQQAMQRVMERKREVERARYVVEAARRNEERLVGTPEERARNAAEIEKMYAEARAQRRADLEAAAGVGSEAGKKPAATQSHGGSTGRNRADEKERSLNGRSGRTGLQPCVKLVQVLRGFTPGGARDQSHIVGRQSLAQRFSTGKAGRKSESVGTAEGNLIARIVDDSSPVEAAERPKERSCRAYGARVCLRASPRGRAMGDHRCDTISRRGRRDKAWERSWRSANGGLSPPVGADHGQRAAANRC